MKYRIVQYGDGYAVQRKVWFCWSYVENVFGVPPLFKTAEEAEMAIHNLLGREEPRVVKEMA